jgi:hypothetical protein
MTTPDLQALLRGSSLRGDAAQLTTASSTRLGRAFGTLARRRAGAPAPRLTLVVARADGADAARVRDGLVRGLLLCGHDVKDIGVAASDVFTFALRHTSAAGGVVVGQADGALSLVFFLGGRPVVGEGLQALAELAAGEDFSAGEGSLDVLDLTAAFRAAPPADVEPEAQA